MIISNLAQAMGGIAQDGDRANSALKTYSKYKTSKSGNLSVDIFKLAERRVQSRLPILNTFQYQSVWRRAVRKIKEKLLRKKYKEIDIYDTAMISDFEGRIRRLTSLISERKSTSTEMEFLPCYMIHPKSKFKKLWNVLMIFILLYTATIMPYRMSFVDGTEIDAWWYIENTVNCIFFLDFIFTCFTAIYNSREKLVTDLRTIFFAYLKGWMIIDLFGILPLDLILESKSKNYNNLLRILRLPRLYRLLKISRIIKFFKSKQGSGFLNSLIEYINIKESGIKLFSFFLTVSICAHVMSCLFFFTAKYNDFSPDTWIMKFNYLDKSSFEQYVASMYWTYTTLSTVGYGDITPGTNLEIIIALLWMVFGIFFFSFTIGSLASMITGVDTKEALLTNKLNIIDEFTKESNINKDLSNRLKAAMRYSTEMEGYSWKNKQDLFNELPMKIRYEVTLAMHKQAAERITFFMDKDPVFITTIIPLLFPVLVAPHEQIYLKNDMADEIYFINKGKVSLIYDEKKMVFCSFTDGSLFGEVEVIREIPRLYNVMSLTSTSLLVLNFEGIMMIKDEFSAVWEDMGKIAKHREVLYAIAIEKANDIVVMRNDMTFSQKEHFEVKSIYNRMIKDEYEKKMQASAFLKPAISSAESFHKIFELAEEVVGIKDQANKMLKKIDEIESIYSELNHK